MCGRYTLRHSVDQVVMRFDATQTTDALRGMEARYNIAPTQPVLMVRERPDAGAKSIRLLEVCQWGLVPRWAKDAKIGSKMINARAEGLAEKPAYRSLLARHRCLVPSDGFYEWKEVDGKKQPVFIRRKDDDLFAFAGLWDRWHSADGSELETCTIITVAPNVLMAPIHDRMPAILSREDEARWLDARTPVPEALSLLGPAPDEPLEAYPVSRMVNAANMDNSGCIEPMTAEA